MLPVSEILKLAQGTSSLAPVETFLFLCRLWVTVLDLEQPLRIFDLSSPDFKGCQSPSTTVQANQLTAVARQTRELLKNALDTRFYTSYNGTPRSLLLEVQTFFHPLFRKLRCLNFICSTSEAQRRRTDVYEFVLTAALQCQPSSANVLQPSNLEQHHPLLSASSPANNTSESVKLWSLVDFENSNDADHLTPTLEEAVRLEMDGSLSESGFNIEEVNSHDLAYWWSRNERRFPHISRVAKSVLGRPTSAGEIERNFGTAGSLISAKRCRLHKKFVDMTLFLHCNHDLIPSFISPLPSQNWKTHIPPSFVGAEELNANQILDQAMAHDTIMDIGVLDML